MGCDGFSGTLTSAGRAASQETALSVNTRPPSKVGSRQLRDQPTLAVPTTTRRGPLGLPAGLASSAAIARAKGPLDWARFFDGASPACRNPLRSRTLYA